MHLPAPDRGRRPFPVDRRALQKGPFLPIPPYHVFKLQRHVATQGGVPQETHRLFRADEQRRALELLQVQSHGVVQLPDLLGVDQAGMVQCLDVGLELGEDIRKLEFRV